MASLAEILSKKKQVVEPVKVVAPQELPKEAPKAITEPAKKLNPLALALANRDKFKKTETTVVAGPSAAVSATAPTSDTPTVAGVVGADEASDNSENAPEELEASSVSHFNHPTQPDAMPLSVEEDLRKTLKMMKDNFSDRPLVGQAIPHIMRSLQENVSLRGILAEEDIGLMVRGLRECYGVAVTIKVEAKGKRTAAAKEKTETAKELDGIFNELGMEL